MKIEKGKLRRVYDTDIVNGVLTLPKEVTEIGGYVTIPREVTKVIGINIVKCGGYSFTNNNSLTSISLPVLTECGEHSFSFNNSLTSISLPMLTECGEYSFRSNNSITSISLPVLTECGENSFSFNNSITSISLPVLTECGENSFRSNKSLTSIELHDQKIKVQIIDGTVFIKQATKKVKDITILKGYVFNNIVKGVIIKTDCYIAQKGDFNAHGDTIKNAIDDLKFKIASKELKKEPIKEDTLMTVKLYRLITGSCDSGCRMFMDANNIGFTVVNNKTVEKNPIKAKDLLPILEKNQAYGINKFKKLLTFKL